MSSGVIFNNERVKIAKQTYKVTALMTLDKSDVFVGLSCRQCAKLMTFFNIGPHGCPKTKTKNTSDYETIFELQNLIDGEFQWKQESVKKEMLSTFLNDQDDRQLQRAIASPKSEKYKMTQADMFAKQSAENKYTSKTSSVTRVKVENDAHTTSTECVADISKAERIQTLESNAKKPPVPTELSKPQSPFWYINKPTAAKIIYNRHLLALDPIETVKSFH